MSKKPLQTTDRVTAKVEDAHQTPVSSALEIAAFLEKAQDSAPSVRPQTAAGKLMFGLDATMSRQGTWDQACQIQAEMFREAGRISGLAIKLVYFRGFSECRSLRWHEDSRDLAEAMSSISCRGGHTQIRKVLAAALKEARTGNLSALVYVGDCMEEDVDDLCARAGELSLLGVPVFLFQEGHDRDADLAFKEIARLTSGAHCRFDQGASGVLADLLRAVAAFASGGRGALVRLERGGSAGARLLIEQMK